MDSFQVIHLPTLDLPTLNLKNGRKPKIYSYLKFNERQKTLDIFLSQVKKGQKTFNRFLS